MGFIMIDLSIVITNKNPDDAVYDCLDSILDTVKNATFEVFVMDTAYPVEFYIDGIFMHSLPYRAPAYLDGAEWPNYETIKELRQSTGGPDFPVATINGECAVSSDEATWGDVKSMFR